MNDVLYLLDEQTTQAETLIARLNERLKRTRELKTLEMERRRLTQNITGLEQRLSELDGELDTWRQMSPGDGGYDEQDAVFRLQQAWADIAGLAPSPPAATADRFDFEQPADSSPLLPESAGEEAPDDFSVVNDAIDVLDSFFSTANDDDYTGGGSTWNTNDFFSNAEGLSDDAGLEDDWWQTDTGIMPAEMPAQEAEQPLAPVVMEIPTGEPQPQTARRGLLGRFF